uniref:RecA family profile 1 domain-containing protein n=1 Tax=Corethron hystrix TaxID=216773 RepID=A0A7S1FQ87_9STRA|mmetsp:Transcript_190/g.408  ORF Transcript_190/g.408 Transcript_190/m.408 type:complete len:530 (+) Transcript_190:338-1927(+)
MSESRLVTAWDLLSFPKDKKPRVTVDKFSLRKEEYEKDRFVWWSDPAIDSFLSSSICLCTLDHNGSVSENANTNLSDSEEIDICSRCHTRRKKESILRPGTITELSGVAGSGKSQMSMQICVGAVIDGECNEAEGSREGTPEDLHLGSVPEQTFPIHHEHQNSQENGKKVKNPYTKHTERNVAPSSSGQNPKVRDDIPLVDLPNSSGKSSSSSNFLKKQECALRNGLLCKGDQAQHLRNKNMKFKDALYVRMGTDAIHSTSTGGNCAARMGQLAAARCRVDIVKDVLSHVHTLDIRNVDDFMDLINNRLPSMMSSSDYDVSVIVFDSIAGIFRDDFDYAVSSESQRESSDPTGKKRSHQDRHEAARLAEASARSGKLFAATAQIKKLSQRHGAPVVMINQVTADFKGAGAGVDGVIPALGLSWSNCINSRIMLSRRDVTNENHATFHRSIYHEHGQRHCSLTNNNTTTPNNNIQLRPQKMPYDSIRTQAPSHLPTTEFHRELHVIFSPNVAPKTLAIAINASGVRGIIK